MDRPSHPLGCCGCCYEKDNRKLLLSNTTPTCNTLAVRRGIPRPVHHSPFTGNTDTRESSTTSRQSGGVSHFRWPLVPSSALCCPASCRHRLCAVRPRAEALCRPPALCRLSGLVPRPCAVLRHCAVYPASCRSLVPSSGLVPSVRPRAGCHGLVLSSGLVPSMSGLVPRPCAVLRPRAVYPASCRGLVPPSGLVPSIRHRVGALCRPPALFSELCRLYLASCRPASSRGLVPSSGLAPCAASCAVLSFELSALYRPPALCRLSGPVPPGLEPRPCAVLSGLAPSGLLVPSSAMCCPASCRPRLCAVRPRAVLRPRAAARRGAAIRRAAFGLVPSGSRPSYFVTYWTVWRDLGQLGSIRTTSVPELIRHKFWIVWAVRSYLLHLVQRHLCDV